MPTLLLENGPQRGSGVELETGRTYSIGRDARCEVVLQDELISRQHCKVKEFKGAWYVRDLESLNGVLVNDRKVTQSQIRFGDKLTLGGAVLTFLEESLEQIRAEKTLGGYLLQERIGRGGMGTVYRALQLSLDRQVALKLLSPDLVVDETFVQLFRREARAAGQLNHPNIVQVYDVGQVEDTFFYSMEYVGGGSLEDLLRERGRIEPNEAVEMILQSARALEFAETRHIVHRDIKPDNLMLTEDGRVKLADLGLALSLAGGATDQSRQPILGTPHFISPEQALRREVDIRSDIYSLGATFYRMLSGRTIFEGKSAEEIILKAVKEQPTPIRELVPEVPEKVAAVVHRMLQKDPDDRYASASELGEELEQLLRHPGRTFALWSAVVVAVVAVAVAGFLALRGPKTETTTIFETDQEARRARAQAMSELDRSRAGLEAVRNYHDALLRALLDGRDVSATDALLAAMPAPQRVTLRDALSTWLAHPDYEFLDLAERGVAAELVERIDRDLSLEEQRLATLQREHSERLESVAQAVEGRLELADYLGAVSAALAFDPSAESTEPLAEAAAQHRDQLLGRALDRAGAHFQSKREEIDEAVRAGQVQEGLELCLDSVALFPAPAEDFPADHREQFQGYAEWMATKREELTSRLADVRQAAQRDDLKVVVAAFGDPLRQGLLQLDLAAPAADLERAREQLSVDLYGGAFQPTLSRIQGGARILDRLLEGLEAGTLPSAPKVRVPSMRDAGELAGYNPEKRSIRVRIVLSVGDSTLSVELREFASPDGLRQLIHGRLELSDEELIDLAGLMITLQVARWAEQLTPLRIAIAAYDEEEGWSEDLRVALAAAEADRDSLSTLDIILRDLSPGSAEAATALRAELAAEQSCYLRLRRALSPFLAGEASIGWHAAAEEIAALLRDEPDRLLLRMVYSLLDSTYTHPLVVQGALPVDGSD